MRPTADHLGWIFIGAAGSSSGLAVLGGPLAYEVQVGLLVGLVALLGLPHGALDLEIARDAGLWRNRAGLWGFFGLYVGLGALVIGLWALTPAMVLAVFLAISAWHFGGDWRARLAILMRFGLGGCIVAVPALFHEQEVGRLFSILVPHSDALLIVEGLRLSAIVCLVSAAFAIVSARHDRQTAIEILALVVAAVALPPLLFFITYFCLLHSSRHLLEAATILQIRTVGEFVRRTWLILTVTWLGGMVALVLLPTTSLSSAAVQVVFVGLAALTVPHMLLIEFWAARAPGAGGRRARFDQATSPKTVGT